ncbi:hypothetical protein HYH03_002521 [Edaphochlamys debaryana]|uniref:inorganic diphosphatase n=1 Tax=Edaphochlamys debaryana TaxID=47281 RepID=A0A835YBE6_9CHLO|nr:hypothetical protein HYH03_002521 [Edaphochlamys debaryana]|eukprot:KAG2499578.1 hypothetical protein HYH03_002521 [Edaphochlamys debaryana]
MRHSSRARARHRVEACGGCAGSGPSAPHAAGRGGSSGHALRRRTARVCAATLTLAMAAALVATSGGDGLGLLVPAEAAAPAPAPADAQQALLAAAAAAAAAAAGSTPAPGQAVASVGSAAPANASAPAGAPAANSTLPTAPSAAPSAAAAASSPAAAAASEPAAPHKRRQHRAPRLLPSAALLAPANGTEFEVYPGCVSAPRGQAGQTDFLVYCVRPDGSNVSYWHHVPLNMTRGPDGSVEFWAAVEIPRGTNAKIETQTWMPYTPMAQSLLSGSYNRTGIKTSDLRYYKVGASLVNYGSIVQTWEASDAPDELTGLPADNDPLDFVEIGAAPVPVGAVVRVRLLGAMTLIDQGETDWKLVTVNTRDPGGASWSDIGDVPAALRQHVFEFFRTYKVAEGKSLNRFWVAGRNATTSAAEDWQEAFVGRDTAAQVLEAKYADWQRLVAGGCTTDRCAPMLAAARASGDAPAPGAAAAVRAQAPTAAAAPRVAAAAVKLKRLQ